MFLLNNSKSRTSLDENGKLKGIRFKVLFKTFDIWKMKLIKYGVKTEIEESDYENLIGMIANSYLRFSTDVKNYSFIAQEFIRLDLIRQRELIIYNKSIEELNSSNVESESKSFLGDNTTDGSFNENFTNAKNTANQKQQNSLIDRLDSFDKFNRKQNPNIKFLRTLASSIVKPYQDGDYGKEY